DDAVVPGAVAATAVAGADAGGPAADAEAARLAADRDGDAELEMLGRVGEVPLPPYVHEPLADPERYQTVYAAHPGSVAAPTAGLHLTHEVLERCRAGGVEVASIELVVGLGTFRPIATERVEDHRMHAERYRVPAETIAAIGRATRVVAVGTTVVRALESWATTGAAEGSSELFVHGDHEFRVVDRLLTNFHVPRSSLLALVQAFVGPRWRDLYAAALADGYRFLSFGDAMLLDRQTRGPAR
ncbi:MAG: queA, partial [Acidimicrobiales bacterium]|nr:queA [Acidimicrobiales bacterium]